MRFGAYRIPPIRQRPILLMGPPGIGKTQIMEQIAEETGVGLVSYTLTHHTRQSALGLPFIETVQLGGAERTVTAYTMSEIIASVYREMERTGTKEGILFLDEINCISETLTPMMLQFLQCKTFGNQRLPDGWMVVAAGNPPEYNKSVREFDVVTLDRVKRIDVEEDFAVWKEYAYRRGIHGAILSYLEIRRDHFYRVEATADGLQFVTARGWEDLSELMQVYETLDLPVDRQVVGNTCSSPAWQPISPTTCSFMKNTSASTAWRRSWTAPGKRCAPPSWRARRSTRSWACLACCSRGWRTARARHTSWTVSPTRCIRTSSISARAKKCSAPCWTKTGRAHAPPRRRLDRQGRAVYRRARGRAARGFPAGARAGKGA